MMKSLVTISVLIAALFSCTVQRSNLIGRFHSTCVLYDNQPVVVINIKNDGTFQYTRPYVEKDVIGEWKAVKDTLILTSDDFTVSHKDEYSPRYKYTEAKDKDVFLIKGKKLLPATMEGFKKECYLVKITSRDSPLH